MMAKIIKGIQKKENSLLESPTGSGKSLALLCSVLAWQSAEKAKLNDQTTGHCTCGQYNGSAIPHTVSSSQTGRLKPSLFADRTNTAGMDGNDQYHQEACPVSSTQQSFGAIVADFDFKPGAKYRKPNLSVKRRHKSIKYDDTNDLEEAPMKDDPQNGQKMETQSQAMLNGTNPDLLQIPSPSILQAFPVTTPSFQLLPAIPVKQESVLCDFCASMKERPTATRKNKAQSR
jgi:hypothetical protein